MCSRKTEQFHAACRHIFLRTRLASVANWVRGKSFWGKIKKRASQSSFFILTFWILTHFSWLPLRGKRMPVNTTSRQFNLMVLFCLALQLLPQSLGETNGLLKIKRGLSESFGCLGSQLKLALTERKWTGSNTAYPKRGQASGLIALGSGF